MEIFYATLRAARKNLALNTEPNQFENCLSKFNTDGANLRGTPPLYAS